MYTHILVCIQKYICTNINYNYTYGSNFSYFSNNKWTKKTDKLCPSAPLSENIDLEKRLEKKINDVNSFNNHVNNIK